MKLLTRISAFFLLACILPVHALTVEDIPNVHVADRTRYVSDIAGAGARRFHTCLHMA